MKALVIESQSHFSSKLCREIYKHTKVGEILGPFGLRDSQGQWVENDHEYVRAVACDLTEGDLASFLSGRDALRAEEYPCMASLETLGVKVIRKSRQQIYEEKVLEILQDMPDTKGCHCYQIMPNMSGFILVLLTPATIMLVFLFKDLGKKTMKKKRMGKKAQRMRR